MNVFKLANPQASLITITTTATPLTSLLDTAAGVANNIPGFMDAADINFESGDVRVLLDGNSPTASQGFLIKAGTVCRFRGTPLKNIILISASASSVTASVQVGQAEPNDTENSSDFQGAAQQVQLLASGSRTTTQTSADLINSNYRGIHIVLDVTSAGTGSITLAINGKDPTSGKYYTLLTGAAVVTNSTNIYKIYPGLTAAANAVANDVLPRIFQIVVTANNANPVTYSLAYSLIP